MIIQDRAERPIPSGTKRAMIIQRRDTGPLPVGTWWVVPVTVKTGTRMVRPRTCQGRSQAERRRVGREPRTQR